MVHPALEPGRVAVVTGAASGIGLAACRRFVEMGLKLCMTDIDGSALDAAVAEMPGDGADRIVEPADVANLDDLRRLCGIVYDRFGEVGVLMNNVVTRIDAGTWSDSEAWRRTIDVNFHGVVNGVQAFLPSMLAQASPAIVVNLGSKQGITNPPGIKPAYNAAKAAVISYTESLQHELRNTEGGRITAHLLVPGWTTTGDREHQQGAWLPTQVVDYLLAAVERGDFYIICPDDEVTSEMDRKRILWAAGDIAENRPPLSRWHPEFGAAFKTFEAED